MSQLLAEGIINELLVTNSEDANRELTKLHEQLFNREPLVASVWRRQTFSAAVATLDPAMALSLFSAHMPAVFRLVNPRPNQLSPPLAEVLEAAYTFSRMLHASRAAASGGAMEAGGFYRAFVSAHRLPRQRATLSSCSFFASHSHRFLSWAVSLTRPSSS